jgi:hypothetical protein
MINTKCERKKNTIASNCLIFQEGNEHILYHGCKGNVNREKRLETTRWTLHLKVEVMEVALSINVDFDKISMTDTWKFVK